MHDEQVSVTSGADGHVDEGTVHAWLDGQLKAADAARVEQHVATCASCRDVVAEARGLIAASTRILNALDGVPAQIVAQPRRRIRVWQLRAAAAVLVMALGSLVVLTRPGVDRLAERTRVASERERAAKVQSAPAAPGIPDASLQAQNGGSPAAGSNVETRRQPSPAKAESGRAGSSRDEREMAAAHQMREMAAAHQMVAPAPQSAATAPRSTPAAAAPPTTTLNKPAALDSAGAMNGLHAGRDMASIADSASSVAKSSRALASQRARQSMATSRPELVPQPSIENAIQGKLSDSLSRVVMGQILDREDRTTIPGAAVLLKGTMESTNSTDSGTFALRVPSDTARLVIQRIGYQAAEIALAPTEDRVTVRLEKDQLKLEAQAVTGTTTLAPAQKKAVLRTCRGQQVRIPAAGTSTPAESIAVQLGGARSQDPAYPGYVLQGVPDTASSVNGAWQPITGDSALIAVPLPASAAPAFMRVRCHQR